MKRVSTVLGIVVFALLLSPRTASAQSGQTLYCADGGSGGHLFKVDPTDFTSFTDIGAVLVGGATPVGITGLAFHPTTGVLYAVSTNQGPTARNLYTINTANAAATLIGSLGSFPVGDISFDQTGTLYGWQKTSGGGVRGALGRKTLAGFQDGLVTISLSTGALTNIGPYTFSGSQGSGLAFVAGTLYLSVSRTDGALRTVDPATGALTLGPTMDGTGNSIPAMSADPAGNLWGVDGGDRAAKINTATGAITSPGFLPSDSIDAMAFQGAGGSAAQANIPALGGTGLLALGALLAISGFLLARPR